jgi:hypothetical protein
MPSTAVLSQGSGLWLLDDTVASPALVRQIKQTEGVSGLGGSRTVIPITNLDSTGVEKQAGLMDAGSIQFSLLFNPLDLSHQLLEALANSTTTKPVKQFYCGLSDGLATVPAFTGTIAGGNLVLQTPKNVTSAVGTASITTTVMTVTAMTSGAFVVGQTITGGTVSGGTVITSFGTGTGQTGTYNVNNSQSVTSASLTGSGTFNARTGFLFSGFVKQWSRAVPVNGVVKVSGAIEITNPVFTAINANLWTQ